METLARFRKPVGRADLSIELDQIESGITDHVRPSTVPASWFDERSIGSARVTGKRFANIYASEWLSFLRRPLEPEIELSGFHTLGPRHTDFDLALLMSQDRALTQKIATLIYGLEYEGIYYQSRHGADLGNWAIFEPFNLVDITQSGISPNDVDCLEAMRRLDLNFDPSR